MHGNDDNAGRQAEELEEEDVDDSDGDTDPPSDGEDTAAPGDVC